MDPSDMNDGIGSWMERLAANPSTLITACVLILAVIGGGVLYTNHQSARSGAANNALYGAQTALTTALKTWQAQLPKGQDVTFVKTDVDAKLGDVIKKFSAVSEQFPGTRAAFEANMTVGDLYLDHGDAAKAIPAFEKAVTEAPKSLDRANALSGLGYSRENAGHPAEALQAYEDALKVGEASLKGDLLLSVARSHELLKEPDKARSTYDEIIAQLPNTGAAKQAEALKAKLH
jgi:tetratricopeptide (TPR) repeat protein